MLLARMEKFQLIMKVKIIVLFAQKNQRMLCYSHVNTLLLVSSVHKLYLINVHIVVNLF